MRQALIIAAIAALAACDDGRLTEPTISNGNKLQQVDCDAATDNNNTVCVVNENEAIDVEPEFERMPVDPSQDPRIRPQN